VGSSCSACSACCPCLAGISLTIIIKFHIHPKEEEEEKKKKLGKDKISLLTVISFNVTEHCDVGCCLDRTKNSLICVCTAAALVG
jgi:hypothetical protein